MDGKTDGVFCGFIVILANGKLNLGCHSCAADDIPTDVQKRLRIEKRKRLPWE